VIENVLETAVYRQTHWSKQHFD